MKQNLTHKIVENLNSNVIIQVYEYYIYFIIVLKEKKWEYFNSSSHLDHSSEEPVLEVTRHKALSDDKIMIKDTETLVIY